MIDKIDNLLLEKIGILSSNVLEKCIIKFRSNNDALDFIKKLNVKKYENFSFVNSLLLELSVGEIYKAASFDVVKYVSSVAKVCTMINVSKDIIGIPKKSKFSNFSTVIIDTGIYPHLDFFINSNVKLIKFIDFVSDKNFIYDDNGHGTFVSSLLASAGSVSGNKYVGVDNKSNLIIIKALDSNGESTAVNILRSMQWVYDNKDIYNIRVVCMSFGSVVLEKNDPLIQGAEALWDKGIVVVSACGNSGPEKSTIKSPSASKKIISVGALNDNRDNGKYNVTNFQVAEFSSRGPILGNYKPDIIVSGVDVVSACNFKINKKFYDTMSGTSVSAPIVAGVVSRLIKKYPNHTPDQIKHILISNCVPISGDRNSEGYGWLDMKKIFSDIGV